MSGLGIALVVSALAGCAPLAQTTGTQPRQAASHLRLVRVDSLTAKLDPCLKVVGMTVTVQVKPDGLDQLAGTVRRRDDTGPDQKMQTAYLTELVVGYSDARGTKLRQDVTLSRVPATSPKAIQVALTSSWNGVHRGADVYAVAAQGELRMDGHVNLLRVRAGGGKVISEELLQTIPVAGKAEVVPPIERCREWVRIAAQLGTGQAGRVKVNGSDSPLEPRISWREERPFAVYGEMGRAAAGDSRLAVVKAFLSRYPRLFGIGSTAVIDSLRLTSENVEPDGTRRLTLRQFVDEQRTVGGVSQLVSVQAERARLVALFDTTDQLVYLSGRFLEDLPVQVPAAQLTSAQAIARVVQDLVTKGLDTGRAVQLKDEVVFGKTASDYRRAYRIAVGPGNRSQFPTETAERRSRTFHYFVSAQNGQILAIRNRTTLTSLLVNGRVLLHDETDPAPDSSDIAVDAPPAVPPCALAVPHRQPARLPPQTRELRIKDRDAPGEPLRLAEDAQAVNGVVEETRNVPDDVEFEWSAAGFFNAPLADPNQDARAVRAMTAYWQIHRFWMVVGQPLAPDWNRIQLKLDDPDRSSCAPGVYQDNRIALDGTYPETVLYAPSHEIFHHFDASTADLRGDDPHVSPFTMPAILKEGVADFFMQFNSPFSPDNSAAVGTRALICILSFNFSVSCVDSSAGPFRSPRILPFPRHRPLRTADGDIDLSPWPDCRIPEGRNIHCMFVRVPGSADPGTFAWSAATTDNLHQRALLPQILQDIWETGASAEPSSHFRALWPITVARAFTVLDDEASFLDYRDHLVITTLLASNQGLWSAGMLGVIGDAFQRHGLDGTLDQFCTDDNTRDQCH